MPHPSDLNRPNHATENPFEEPTRRIAEYTAAEIATLQARLDKQLGPEYISTRPGAGGGKLHYLAADKAINLANEVFGFNGWSSAIQQVQVDFVDEIGGGKINLGLSTIVRVTLKDGTYHEDVGYGHIENCKGKATAFEKAKKEAATDALKRALRNFGNVLGNCLYDKDYLGRITKIKVAPSKWSTDNLHRHHDYAPIKKESIDDISLLSVQNINRTRSDRSNVTNGTTEYGEDEFGGNLFEEVDFSHPDEVRLEDSTVSDLEAAGANAPSRARPATAQSAQPNPQKPSTDSSDQRFAQQRQRAEELQRQRANQQTYGGTKPTSVNVLSNNGQQAVHDPAQPPAGEPLPGFVTGRSADKPGAQPFNPRAESPSIRRTAGINSGKSEPIMRTTINGQTTIMPAPDQQTTRGAAAAPTKMNFVNPSADMHRRVGMPMAPQSPMANRGAYKPPTAIKRPAQPEPPIRAPLADTTNVVPADSGPDLKRPKVEGAPDGEAENAPEAPSEVTP